MSNVSQFLKASGGKPTSANGPGSNGFWRRHQYWSPGTYTFTAPKDGNVLIEALGAGAGGSGAYPGASAGYGRKLLAMTAGQTLTVVVGLGGAGAASGTPGGNGGSTSISGTPVGATPLTLVGATGANGVGTAGTATGSWDVSFTGAVAFGPDDGSPSSGSPFGNGFPGGTGGGGAGWGGTPGANGGASSHFAGSITNGPQGARGIHARAGGLLASVSPQNLDGESLPFWGLDTVDSAGGNQSTTATMRGGNAGPGGGGAAGNGHGGGHSSLGGGTGLSFGYTPPKSGKGAGGGATNSGNAGQGGDGFVQIFWDEVG